MPILNRAIGTTQMADKEITPVNPDTAKIEADRKEKDKAKAEAERKAASFRCA